MRPIPKGDIPLRRRFYKLGNWHTKLLDTWKLNSLRQESVKGEQCTALKALTVMYFMHEIVHVLGIISLY